MESPDGVGVCDLTVLGEFKPFGLIEESADGVPPTAGAKHHYFLFDSGLTRCKPSHSLEAISPPSSGGGDHEIFIRSNRLIWSSGSRIQRIYTCQDTIVTACWCQMHAMPEPFLCVLQPDTLSMYSASGEDFSIPLTHAVVSIWPLPFGLLIQRSADEYSTSGSPLTPTGSLRSARDLSWRNSDHVPGSNMFAFFNSRDIVDKEDLCGSLSHLILRHPLEEPQPIVTMKDFDERVSWSSDTIPMLATHHKGKMKHSIWIVDVSQDISDADCVVESGETYSLRRIWQGKCSQVPAKKVFLATDNNGMPIVCFLLQDQRNLLFVRLDVQEGSDGVSFDAKPHLSWSIPSIDAAPVAVTRSGVEVGLVPFYDVIILTPENSLLLYTGNQCVCRYVLPAAVLGTPTLQNMDGRGGSSSSSRQHNVRIIELADAVKWRINLLLSNGKIYRCALLGNPPSPLVDDCVSVLSLGLHPSFYNLFCRRFWGQHASHASSHADCNWESFVEVITEACKKHRPNRSKLLESSCTTSWDYLLSSKFHVAYCRHGFISHPVVSASSSDNLDLSVSSTVDKEYMDRLSSSQFLSEVLDSLHALYESLKLDILRKLDVEQLASLLCDVAVSLGETSYVDHYIRDFPSISVNAQYYQSPQPPRNPPCIFRWLESCLKYGYLSADIVDLPLLITKEGSSALSWARKVVSFYSLLLGAEMIDNRLLLGIHCDIAQGTRNNVEESTVLAMVAEGFDIQQLDLLPAGIALPLRHALDKCRECPPTDWPPAAYVLIGREDMALGRLGSLSFPKEQIPQVIKSLISTSVPYKLHLQPVSVPPSISDVENLNIVKFQDSDSPNSYLLDGMEHIFNSSTQLRYGRDLRLNEVRRCLCSARPVVVHTAPSHGATDQDLQQNQLWNLAHRTTALPLGRGAFTLATSYALLTEAVGVPKLVLSGRLPSQQNATVNIDPNFRNIDELKRWPEFHNGVAAGLKLAPFEGKISKSWIRYNKPEKPNDAHAGVLLALGLHGHLRVLVVTDIVGYLQPQHEISTVGILLGMAAAHRGTMHPAISKAIQVHIPSRFLFAFPDLEMHAVTQSAALMALGLLYEGTGHPSTMKVLMGEIGRISSGDNVPEREGYALAAGSALGLVALGRGHGAFGFNDNSVDRLFQYIGGPELYSDRCLMSGLSIDPQSRGAGQVVDGTPFNVDVTAPGATISLALIYLKTECEIIAAKLSLPTTKFELQYVRPDFLMLRIIARNLIMWSQICPSRDWVEVQIPEVIKLGITMHDDTKEDCNNIDMDTLVQAYVNIIAGACICIGLRYAGTRNAEAHDLLYAYAINFLNEMKPICGSSGTHLLKGLLSYVDRGTLEQCLHLIVLSLSVVMAGSGHLRTFRLLRYLRNRISAEGNVNYGIQMVVNLAIGFLFLGGGTLTFSTGNSAIAALLITLYPRLPTGPNDNRCHLQAFRHFYVIAAESRFLQTVDVDTGLEVYAPLEVTVCEAEHYAETSFCQITPFSLPERASLKRVRICGPRYWPQVINLMPENKPWWKSGDKNNPFNGGVLYVKCKVGASSYVEDPIGCQSLLSRARHKVTGSAGHSVSASGSSNESAMSKINQLVTAFSADPSLISFAKHCCDSSANLLDASFLEFCSQVIVECISKDRPTLLQVYLSMYTSIGLMGEQVQSVHALLHDSLFLLDLKVAVAYKDAVTHGRLKGNDHGIIQINFIESLRKRVEEILQCFQLLRPAFLTYLQASRWPCNKTKAETMLLSWYLQWYDIPPSHTVKLILQKLKDRASVSTNIPFLHLLLPKTHVKALADINSLRNSLSI